GSAVRLFFALFIGTLGCGTLIVLVCLPEQVSAQTTVYTYRGTNTCTKSGCHQKEKEWFDREDGPPQNGHKNAFAQLTRDLDKSRKYAMAIDQMDPQDAGG